MIDQNLIEAGIKNGIVKFIVDPNTGSGTVCQIGDYWFYFGGQTAEEEGPEEYLAHVPMDDIAREIVDALKSFVQFEETKDEFEYYNAVLREAIVKAYGHKVYTPDDFDYATVRVGDEVTAEEVMNAMDCMPPACMRLDCAQMGEPYSHREDPSTKKFRPVFATFKSKGGDFRRGIWEFRGYCFRGENVERGKDPVYCCKSFEGV